MTTQDFYTIEHIYKSDDKTITTQYGQFNYPGTAIACMHEYIFNVSHNDRDIVLEEKYIHIFEKCENLYLWRNESDELLCLKNIGINKNHKKFPTTISKLGKFLEKNILSVSDSGETFSVKKITTNSKKMYCVNLYDSDKCIENWRIITQPMFSDLNEAVNFTMNDVLNLNNKNTDSYIEDRIDGLFEISSKGTLKLFGAEYYGIKNGILTEKFFEVSQCTYSKETLFPETVDQLKAWLTQFKYCFFRDGICKVNISTVYIDE